MDYNTILFNTFDDFLKEYYIKHNYNSSLKGRILELITCLKFNCLLNDNIDSNFKKQNNLPILDNGIDCIDMTNKIIYQCKFYKKNTKIAEKELFTFITCCCNSRDKDFKYYLIKTEDVKNPFLPDNVETIIISDDEIREYIIKSIIFMINNESITFTNYKGFFEPFNDYINKNIEFLLNDVEHYYIGDIVERIVNNINNKPNDSDIKTIKRLVFEHLCIDKNIDFMFGTIDRVDNNISVGDNL